MPDVALVDIGLPGMYGIEGIRLLKERHPGMLLLMLTVYDDDERHLRRAVRRGVRLPAEEDAARAPDRELARGGRRRRADVAGGRAPRHHALPRGPPARARRLPPDAARERLLKLLVEGHNYKTAAVELGVSVTTVAFHMRNIYDKLQVHSKSEAVAKALRNRLVERADSPSTPFTSLSVQTVTTGHAGCTITSHL